MRGSIGAMRMPTYKYFAFLQFLYIYDTNH